MNNQSHAEDEDTAVLASMEAHLREILRALKQENRWRTLQQFGVTRESILEHMVKMAVIMHTMNAYEQQAGNPHNLPTEALLWCAITHDLGESIVGDTPSTAKTYKTDMEEHEAFADIASSLTPPSLTGKLLPQPIDRQDNAPKMVQAYWQAAEQIGYVQFIKTEMSRSFISHTLQEQCKAIYESYRESLRLAAGNFVSVQHFYKALYPEA